MRDNKIWKNERRFNSYTEYLKKEFGGRIQKLAIDAGFTCPNRDGSKGTGGCTFCNNDAFNPSYCNPSKSITRQIEEGIEFHRLRYRRAKGYFAYFQAYTNTYENPANLQKLYDEALAYPGVMGLIIGTRPDCVNSEILDMLTEYNRETFVVVEYGVETVKDETLARINRGHDFQAAVNSIMETNKRGIRTGAHMIIGLPGETEEDIFDGIRILSRLPLFSVKFHQLQIIKGTRMEIEYKEHPSEFRFHSLDEYLELMASVISLLNPRFVIDRIAGEVPLEYNVNTSWELRYDQVLARFEEILDKTGMWQGKFYVQ